MPDVDADAAADAAAEVDEAGVAGPTNWAIALPARSAETARTRMVLAVLKGWVSSECDFWDSDLVVTLHGSDERSQECGRRRGRVGFS